MPKRGKNFATLRDFIEESSDEQQEAFWKRVAKEAKRFCAIHGRVWISVHGLGVAYTHVRIATSPKYYFAKEFLRKT
jgi:hypothetical protein